MFEYKVVPAPRRGLKGKGVKGNEARFANALQTIMNSLAQEGWEYQRTDTLPSEEREGLMGRTTVFQNLLVFRRQLDGSQAESAVAAASVDETPLPEDKSEELIDDGELTATEEIVEDIDDWAEDVAQQDPAYSSNETQKRAD